MKHVSRLLVFVFLSMLLLSGCGSAPTEVTVDMQEFMFTPSEITVPAGEVVNITLINNGAVEHEFVIMKFGKEVSVPFNEDDEDNIYWEHEVEPGATETVTFTAPADSGEYQLVCGIAGHLEGGMQGVLTVK